MPDTLRLFFALPCPASLAGALSGWMARQSLTGRPVPTENLHLTLAFLGAQPTTRLETLYQVADAIRSAPIELTLDRLHRTRRGLLWIEPSTPPQPLLTLADALRARLSAVAIPFDSQAFRAHVTLIRDGASPPTLAPPALRWHAEHFGLYVSDSVPGGVRYRPLRQWPLQAP